MEESTKAKVSARDAVRLERQRKLAEIMRQKADTEERGEDVERQKNWEWTIEENDEWEKRQARKARRGDFEFHSSCSGLSERFTHTLTLSSPTDDSDAVRRKYKKDLDHLKPDLEAYNRQKEVALGLAPGALTKAGEGSSVVVPTSQEQRLAADNLYRHANTLIYGDNKPSEEAIDKVVSKINQECVFSHFYMLPKLMFRSVDKKRKFSRKRANEDEGDITYINERNRVFNKKVSCSYDSRFGCSPHLSLLLRSPGFTTNTPRKFGRVSNVALRCRGTAMYGIHVRLILH